jgi:hypothetical protein
MKYIALLLVIFSFNAKAQQHGPYAFDSYYRLKNWSYDLSDFLYLERPVLNQTLHSKNIAVFFGNDDYSGEINRSIISAFKSLMSANCIDYITLCQFTNVSGNRMVKRFNNGTQLTVEFFSPEKGKESQTQNAFFEKLGSATQIFYVGHSRYGKGPDFFPINNGKSISVESIVQKLKARGSNTIGTLGLISCSSDGHFGQALKNQKLYSNLYLTKQSIPIAMAEKSLFALLNLELGNSSQTAPKINQALGQNFLDITK